MGRDERYFGGWLFAFDLRDWLMFGDGYGSGCWGGRKVSWRMSMGGKMAVTGLFEILRDVWQSDDLTNAQMAFSDIMWSEFKSVCCSRKALFSVVTLKSALRTISKSPLLIARPRWSCDLRILLIDTFLSQTIVPRKLGNDATKGFHRYHFLNSMITELGLIESVEERFLADTRYMHYKLMIPISSPFFSLRTLSPRVRDYLAWPEILAIRVISDLGILEKGRIGTTAISSVVLQNDHDPSRNGKSFPSLLTSNLISPRDCTAFPEKLDY